MHFKIFVSKEKRFRNFAFYAKPFNKKLYLYIFTKNKNVLNVLFKENKFCSFKTNMGIILYLFSKNPFFVEKTLQINIFKLTINEGHFWCVARHRGTSKFSYCSNVLNFLEIKILNWIQIIFKKLNIMSKKCSQAYHSRRL